MNFLCFFIVYILGGILTLFILRRFNSIEGLPSINRFGPIRAFLLSWITIIFMAVTVCAIYYEDNHKERVNKFFNYEP